MAPGLIFIEVLLQACRSLPKLADHGGTQTHARFEYSLRVVSICDLKSCYTEIFLLVPSKSSALTLKYIASFLRLLAEIV